MNSVATLEAAAAASIAAGKLNEIRGREISVPSVSKQMDSSAELLIGVVLTH